MIILRSRVRHLGNTLCGSATSLAEPLFTIFILFIYTTMKFFIIFHINFEINLGHVTKNKFPTYFELYMFKGVLLFMYSYWQSYYSPIITLMYTLTHLYVITELVKTRIFKRLYAFLMGTTCRLDEISYYKYCFQFTRHTRYSWTASSKCNTYGTIARTILW